MVLGSTEITCADELSDAVGYYKLFPKRTTDQRAIFDAVNYDARVVRELVPRVLRPI